MTQHRRQAAKSDKKTAEDKRPAEQKADERSGDSCRCKEVSKKTIPEMIKLMISDLTFRKKQK